MAYAIATAKGAYAIAPNERAYAIARAPHENLKYQYLILAVFLNETVDVFERFAAAFFKSIAAARFFFSGIGEEMVEQCVGVENAQIFDELTTELLDAVEAFDDAGRVPGGEGGSVVDSDDATGLEMAVGAIIILSAAVAIPVVGEKVYDCDVRELAKHIASGEIACVFEQF